jgi:hypothetical protein
MLRDANFKRNTMYQSSNFDEIIGKGRQDPVFPLCLRFHFCGYMKGAPKHIKEDNHL